MWPESDHLEAYLAATEVIDCDHPKVRQQAHAVVAGMRHDVDQTRALFEWVRDTIPHSGDIQAEVVTCTASDVLHHGTGICYAKSHLLAAVLRAIRIPAGFCYQVLRKDPPYHGMVLHGLNGVFIPSLHQWIRLDPRGNVGGINAQFSLTEERLAFPLDATQGEYMYEMIFVAPASEVVEVLQRFSRRSAMWPHLPSALQHPLPLVFTANTNM
jgi:transglutaminase-like putative cysteine protease